MTGTIVGDLALWAGRGKEKPAWVTDLSLSVACYTCEQEAYVLGAQSQQRCKHTIEEVQERLCAVFIG